MNLPNPFDLARDLGLPTPPNPSDILNSLPNPFEMFGGGGSNGGGGSGSGGPFDIFGGLPPPKSPKDLVHKILDPIGLFG